jgi:uncharacterized repeat protein (TIGR03803 family)
MRIGGLIRTFGAWSAIVWASAVWAQTFSSVFSFNGTDGAYPDAVLVQSTNGDLYGTASQGAANGNGSVFRVATSGTLTTLYNFCSLSACADGANPRAGLVQTSSGDFYGTTYGGGANGSYGTVFKITTSGMLTTLYSFCAKSGCADGEQPWAGLIEATNGDFYGTTYGGGANGNYGTVFKITTSGVLTTLHSFCAKSGCTDGAQPIAGLVQATNGDLYGTTFAGGANGEGTIFKITPGGALKSLYSFCSKSLCADGAGPSAGLIQASDGNLYGTTAYYGANFGVGDGGTVFQFTISGEFTTLYDFCSLSECADGESPVAPLVQATDGDLYGTTYNGGGFCSAPGCGTVFRTTLSGTLTSLHSFCSQGGDCTDGRNPAAGLVQATDGALYGTTSSGAGPGFDGNIFSLSIGAVPFVETQPSSGKVGARVKILGTDLTGATSVTFNGTLASFTVVSASEISTTVPDGATTGEVEVVTPGGTLSSNVVFQVLP